MMERLPLPHAEWLEAKMAQFDQSLISVADLCAATPEDVDNLADMLLDIMTLGVRKDSAMAELKHLILTQTKEL